MDAEADRMSGGASLGRSTDMLTMALLGAGRIGQIHGRNVADNPRAALVAIADADAKAAAALSAATGAKVATIDAIMDDKAIAAVAICTPTDTHADLIERAVKAGKAVFCEKPVSLDSARIETCLKVVGEAKGKLMIAFNRRFDPSFADVKRRIDAGEVGNVELVTILSRDPAPPPVGYVERSGGLYRDMMIHDLDMACFLLGEEPVELHAVGANLIDPAIGKAGDVDTAAVLLKTASGRIAQISNSRRATYGYDQRIEVHGSKGLLVAGNHHATTVTRANGDGYATDPALPFFLERYAEAYRLELDAFITAVLDGKPISPTGEDGLKAQRLADAATEASQSGQPVKLAG
jgi:myo-inositol 2-dehydrogenase/D-chiro-inositol 1-dehydrogenase